MDNLILISTIEEYKEAIKNKAIIMFTAAWCPDCVYTKSYIGDIVLNNPDFKFYYIDRDQLLDLCIELNITGIPSFIGYDNSNKIGEFISKDRKSQEEVQSFINELRG